MVQRMNTKTLPSITIMEQAIQQVLLTGPSHNSSGQINGADNFDGIDDYVRVPQSQSLQITGNQITIEAWVNISAFDSDK